MNIPTTLADPSGLYAVWMGNCEYNETDFYVNGQYDSSEMDLVGCASAGSSSGGGPPMGGGGPGGGFTLAARGKKRHQQIFPMTWG
jgi:hypothetical protein